MQPLSSSPTEQPPASEIPLLVAEDEPVSQIVIQRLLARLGYSADIVATGVEALAALKKKKYALVLMDCQMPEMTGTEVTATVRSLPPGSMNREVPIVALTANVFAGERERFMAAGMNDFVAKPYDPDTVKRVLVKWLVAATVTPDVFDGNELLTRHYGDHTLAAELVELFVEKGRSYISAIGTALAAGDMAGARIPAHTLKGAAATLGAHGISAAAGDLEKAIGEGPMEVVLRLAESLAEEFERLLTVLSDQGWLDRPDHSVLERNGR